MNTIECHIDESDAQRNEQEFAEFNLIIELDDSQLQQVAGGKEAIIPTEQNLSCVARFGTDAGESSCHPGKRIPAPVRFPGDGSR